MPQFDTFTFLSQLFWVFTIFCLFYLAIAYYILPAVAITLKVRRRKLSVSTPSSSLSLSAAESNLVSFLNVSIDSIVSKQFTVSEPVEMQAVDVLSVEKLTFQTFAVKLSTNLTGLVLQR